MQWPIKVQGREVGEEKVRWLSGWIAQSGIIEDHCSWRTPQCIGRRNFYSVKVENYFWGRSAGFMLR
jgi:hypothetical protein